MSSLEQQIQQLQQQLQSLMQRVEVIPDHMQPEANQAAPLHSLGIRLRFEWTPTDFLVNFLNLHQPIHTSAPLTDIERKSIIEAYPPIADVNYQAPATIPSAAKRMNKGQKCEDLALKQLQYMLSVVLRPLDILAHELASHESNNDNLERYLVMIKDVRKLLLHVSSSMNQARNNIALRSFNPAFSVKADEGSYTAPLSDFQTMLTQQTAERKNIQEATSGFRKRNGRLHGDPSFFRSGPSSQQGGFLINTIDNNNFNYNTNTNSNSNFSPNFNNALHNTNNNKRSHNLFRQQNPPQPKQH